MIILTLQQADAVTGPTLNGAALRPRETIHGTFALPEEVLADPNHAMHHALLSSLPTQTLTSADFPVVTE